MSRQKALWTIYGSVVISYLGVGLVAPLISLMLSRQGVDSFVIGLLGTTMFGAFAVASFPVGTATDKVGPKPVLVLGLIFYSLAVLSLAFIKVTWLFFVIRTFEGIGAAAITVATETMISKLSDPLERARRMSYYGLSVGIGWSLGPLTGIFLYGIFSWLPFAACSGLSIAAGLIVLAVVPATSGDHHPTRLFEGMSLDLAVPLLAATLYGYLMSSLVTLFPLYLDQTGFKDVEMGGILTSVIAGTMLCQVPIGRAADRYGKRRVLFCCAAGLTVIFALMPSHSQWAFFVAIGPIVGALAGSLYPIGLALLAGMARENQLGTMTALFSLSFGIGSLSGPGLSGLAMNQIGIEWLFYLPAILTGLFMVTLVVLYSRTSRARAARSSLP